MYLTVLLIINLELTGVSLWVQGLNPENLHWNYLWHTCCRSWNWDPIIYSLAPLKSYTKGKYRKNALFLLNRIIALSFTSQVIIHDIQPVQRNTSIFTVQCWVQKNTEMLNHLMPLHWNISVLCTMQNEIFKILLRYQNKLCRLLSLGHSTYWLVL